MGSETYFGGSNMNLGDGIQHVSNSSNPHSFSYSTEMKGKRFSHKGASPVVLQWLTDNYECQEGSSLPRSQLYNHYLRFCSMNNFDPINPASFGKLIRSVFPSLKTRRLGTRGHSKYHYYGVNVKSNSELRHISVPSGTDDDEDESPENTEDYLPISTASKPPQKRKKEQLENNSIPQDSSMHLFMGGISPQPHPTSGVPHITLPEFHLPENISPDASSFMQLYRQYCQSIVDAAHEHLFSEVEKTFRHFWQVAVQPYRQLLVIPVISQQVIEKDHQTYKTMIAVLLPNVLQPMPVALPQSIRQFAKQLESWLASSLDGLPTNFCVSKLMVIKKYGQILHKQASLNHLAQAARAVLHNTNQTQQMINDWSQLDFEFIRDLGQVVCQCGDDILMQVQDVVKRLLSDRSTLEQWTQWLSDIVQKILGKYSESREYVSSAQQFLMKWSYYSTLIVRDLTIRNAPSFGSFHLLRTLFDEYVFYLIESKSLPYHPYANESLHQQQHAQSQEPMVHYSYPPLDFAFSATPFETSKLEHRSEEEYGEPFNNQFAHFQRFPPNGNQMYIRNIPTSLLNHNVSIPSIDRSMPSRNQFPQHLQFNNSMIPSSWVKEDDSSKRARIDSVK
eukprot:TRINITY_DN13735_c0_g1_i4.p1 TRINITY_DN13735_c0_g1~~TRINITY_DN13735_c0_g1_i4.p1  ORF type:complete len:619 (-),score=154.84 TRINITY_DN13735_c0_g1_i4:117-1973(-)